jgi:hypothetical protein
LAVLPERKLSLGSGGEWVALVEWERWLETARGRRAAESFHEEVRAAVVETWKEAEDAEQRPPRSSWELALQSEFLNMAKTRCRGQN